MSTELLFSPTLEKVNSVLARLAGAANKGCRARTATLEVTPEQWEQLSLKIEAGGEVPGRAYANKTFTKPTTTVVGVVWAVGGDGRRIVLVHARRETVYPGRGSLHAFGLADRVPFQIVYKYVKALAEGGVGHLVPTGLDSAKLTPAGHLALLRLLEAGPPVVLPDVYPNAVLGWQTIADHLRATVRLHEGRYRIENGPFVESKLDNFRSRY